MKEKKPIINLILLTKTWTERMPSLKEDIPITFEKTAEILGKNFSQTEVSIVLSDDQEVQNLNKTFRHKDKLTNVLSFPSKEKGELGDIILAYETVTREADEKGISPVDHTLHLIIHGFLHLLGYDHEKESDAQRMEALEVQVLKILGISNPYEDQ